MHENGPRIFVPHMYGLNDPFILEYYVFGANAAHRKQISNIMEKEKYNNKLRRYYVWKNVKRVKNLIKTFESLRNKQNRNSSHYRNFQAIVNGFKQALREAAVKKIQSEYRRVSRPSINVKGKSIGNRMITRPMSRSILAKRLEKIKAENVLKELKRRKIN